MSVLIEAEKLSKEGSSYFNLGDFENAVRFYTKAIEVNNKVSTYFSNRGRAYRSLGKANLSTEDAQEAIELDESNIKAHYLMGFIKSTESSRHCQKQQRF